MNDEIRDTIERELTARKRWWLDTRLYHPASVVAEQVAKIDTALAAIRSESVARPGATVMETKQYVWRVPDGVMVIMAVGDESYYVDNDREIRADAIPLVALTPEVREAIALMRTILVTDLAAGAYTYLEIGEQVKNAVKTVSSWLDQEAYRE